MQCRTKVRTDLSNLLSTDLSKQKYMSLQELDYLGENIFISRLGYTGEDGFEISISNDKITKLWNDLLLNEQVNLGWRPETVCV